MKNLLRIYCKNEFEYITLQQYFIKKGKYWLSVDDAIKVRNFNNNAGAWNNGIVLVIDGDILFYSEMVERYDYKYDEFLRENCENHISVEVEKLFENII